MSTEIESQAVLLIGAVPQPITSEPAAFLIYLLLAIVVGSALASVLLRNALFAIASFIATMAGVAFLYLMLAPFLLFALQLLLFTTVSALLLVGLIRMTSGLDSAPDSPFSPELIAGSAVAAVLLALLAVVVGATNWPVRVAPDFAEGIGHSLTTTYIVGLGVLVVIIASAALGAGLLRTVPVLRRGPAGGAPRPGQGRQRSGERGPRP